MGAVGRVRVDASPASALAVCDCGWRSAPSRYRSDAWREADQHIRTCHADDRTALTAASKREQRRVLA